MKIDFNSLLQKNKWNLIAIAVFFIVSCIFYYPSLQGYYLSQDDVKNFIGMSQEIQDYRIANDNEEPLWTNAMFSGMPATQISTQYDGRFVTDFFSGLFQLWLPRPLGYLFVFFLSFFFMARCFKIKPIISIIGALAFGLSTYFIIILDVGHNTKALTMAFTPFLIGSFVLAFREKTRWIGIGLSALFMALQFRLNHPQITYYISFIIFGMGVVYLIEAIKNKKIKSFGFSVAGVLVAYLIGFMVNYGSLLGTLEYAPYTIRGKTDLTINPNGTSNANNETSGLSRDYVTNWSYGVGETYTFLVPDFKGGGSKAFATSPEKAQEMQKNFMSNQEVTQNLQLLSPKKQQQYFQKYLYSSYYFGDQPMTSGPVYVGAIVLVLSVLALIYVKNPLKWAFFAVTVLTVMLSWGKNFPGLTNFFLDHFPMYNKFRAVTIILVVAELTIPLLGIMFLSRLIKKREEIKENIKPLYITLGAFVFILLLMWMSPSIFTDFTTQKEALEMANLKGPEASINSFIVSNAIQEREQVFSQSVLRSLLFVLMGGGLILAYVKTNFRKNFLLLGLGVLIFIDLASYDMNFIGYETEGDRPDWLTYYQYRYPYNELNSDNQIYLNETKNNPEVNKYISTKLDSLRQKWNEKGIELNDKQRLETWWKFRLLNRKTNYRVFDTDNPFNSSRASYFHKSIGGYHGAKLGRYQDLISFHIGKFNQKVLDMLNTKYTIAYTYDKNGNKVDRLSLRQSHLGNAWFVKNIKWVETADEEILSLGATYQIDVKDAEGIDLRLNAQPFTGGEVDQNQDLEIWRTVQDPNTNKVDTIKRPIRLDMGVDVGQKIAYAEIGGEGRWASYRKEMEQGYVAGLTVYNADSLALQTLEGIQFFRNGKPFTKGIIRMSDTITYKMEGQSNTKQISLNFSLQPGAGFVYYPANTTRTWTSVNDPKINRTILEAEKISDFDPSNEAIVNSKYSDQISGKEFSGEGEIKLNSYAPNYLKYTSNSSDKQFAVFSEIYYPLGWKAYIDGEEVEILQVDYTLRGLEIPAGEHEIEFKYELESYHTATYMAYAGSFLLIIVIAGSVYFQYRKQ